MQIRALRGTLLWVVLVTLLLSQRHFGFALYFLLLALIPLVLYSIYVSVRYPNRRAIQGAKLALWAGAVATILAVHYHLHVTTRARADEIIAAVRSYRQGSGAYPTNLQAIGISDAELRARLGLSGYSIRAGDPELYYASTYIPFAIDYYEFRTGRWRHKSD